MNCSMKEELLQEYIEGNLNPAEEAIVEEHIKNCEGCKREVTSLKLLMWELDGLKDLDVPSDAAAAGRKAVDEFERSRKTKSQSTVSIVKKQMEVMKISGLFLDYVPGFKKGQKMLSKGIKRMPSVIIKGARGAVSGGMRLMNARAGA